MGTKFFFAHHCLPTFPNNFFIAQIAAMGSFKLSLNVLPDLRTTNPRRFKSPKSTSDYFRSLQLFKFLKSRSGYLLATKPYLLFLQTGHFSNLKNRSEKCYLFFFSLSIVYLFSTIEKNDLVLV